MKNPKSEVIKYAKMLNSKKLSVLRSGNISIRYKGGFFITPSGVKYSLLKIRILKYDTHCSTFTLKSPLSILE